ncbi:MAG: hypothetical protein IT304_04820 [Dehalococcoidia bacterium]|nr:hypothetical protein [Dehalococcoidia bacterium]
MSKLIRSLAAVAALGAALTVGVFAMGGSSTTKAAFSNVSCDPNNEVVVLPGAYNAGGSGSAAGINISGNFFWGFGGGPANISWTTAAKVTGNLGMPGDPAPGTLNGNLTLTIKPTGVGAPPKAVFTSDCIAFSLVDSNHYVAVYHGWFSDVPGWIWSNEEALVAFVYSRGVPAGWALDIGVTFNYDWMSNTCYVGPDLQFAIGTASGNMYLPGNNQNNVWMGRRVTSCDGNWAWWMPV